MKEIRLLFTGVGRRIELLQAFRQAADSLHVRLKLYGADMNGTAPALAYCDETRIVCGMHEANYVSELADICQKDGIDLLIPTIDTDLLILSQNKRAFGNTGVLISAPDKIALCRDKNLTAEFFRECGLKAPETVNDLRLYQSGYPCFIKPKDGSSSVNAYRAENEEELKLHARQIEEYVIQPFIRGTEYTVDIFCDFEGKPVCITPRIRLQVRAGEVLKTEISMDEKIIEECKAVVDRFHPVGPITVQLIRERETKEDYFIEINPRYGGGAPLSIKAGAGSPKALLKLLMKEPGEENIQISDGAVYSRFDQSVCITEGKIRQPVKGIIFDLDDTLYKEKQYIRSGFKALSRHLGRPGDEEKLWKYYQMGKPAIDAYLTTIGLSARREECIRLYREHMPEIALESQVPELMAKLKKSGIRIGIITDGRPEGQRNKIAALGLWNITEDIIITDELGGEQFRKPCDIAFRIMQRRWGIPFEQMLYAGDNVHKDFQAPRQLGMQWILIDNGEGIYPSGQQGVHISQLKNLKGLFE
ncbi:MAG: ATP-grasp domain-containing protein [Lachnospiraceae bacterium]|nr:ATP-grasp domain-containing protein [Lachnospiraceae bacterium]